MNKRLLDNFAVEKVYCPHCSDLHFGPMSIETKTKYNIYYRCEQCCNKWTLAHIRLYFPDLCKLV
jgi:hypothetical protein